MKIRELILWKIMQLKAVWRIMAFIYFFTLFLGIKFSDSADVARTWAGAATDNSLLVKSINDVMMTLTMYVWRYLFMNCLWLSFFSMAPVLQIVPHPLIASLVTFDGVRGRYLHRGIYSMTAIANDIGLRAARHRQGAPVNIFVGTNSVGLSRGDNFHTPAEVKRDTSSAHWDVPLSLILDFGINALAWIGLFFLPSQKLDA
ncbi:hypothetical protein PybrP1_009942 [[Pythium] brassicae (nom. inval.)]|nr:hypothetical protein PybrP1_009942 [[Pythium] brassicae (nom. inval.)]